MIHLSTPAFQGDRDTVLAPLRWRGSDGFDSVEEIIEADFNYLISAWYLDQIDAGRRISPIDFQRNQVNAIEIRENVRSYFLELGLDLESDELIRFTKAILARIRSRVVRTQRSQQDKLALLERNLDPRCHLCGSLFDSREIDDFISGIRHTTPLPSFLDLFRPKGRKERDSQIEIDHVVPVSRGGSDEVDNLRLACGWCNVSKSASEMVLSIGERRESVFFEGESFLIPRRSWVVNIVSRIGRCQESGCKSSLENAELFVAPKQAVGDANPLNLRVVCCDHDDWSIRRLVDRNLFSTT